MNVRPVSHFRSVGSEFKDGAGARQMGRVNLWFLNFARTGTPPPPMTHCRLQGPAGRALNRFWLLYPQTDVAIAAASEVHLGKRQFLHLLG